MMLESEILRWFAANLPSVITGLAAAAIFLRLNRYANRLEKVEKRQRRMMEVCSEQHPDKAKAIFDDESSE
jgi:hypothetical protein